MCFPLVKYVFNAFVTASNFLSTFLVSTVLVFTSCTTTFLTPPPYCDNVHPRVR